jgi:hypothetical protein
VYADFTGQGKNYTQFPDRQSFRVYLEDLRTEEVRERLKTIWLEPQSLDPTRKAAKANHERAAEEQRGYVRWLRPDYQIPRFGQKLDKQAAKEKGAQVIADLGLPEPGARKPAFPTDAVSQTAAVFAGAGCGPAADRRGRDRSRLPQEQEPPADYRGRARLPLPPRSRRDT